MRLYDSGDLRELVQGCLCAAQLGVALEIVPVDILRGESRTPEFLRMNPNGRTPLLDDDGFVLAESNAILAYLARGTRLLPDDRRRWALVFQWLFFEQYSHEPFIATSRFWLLHKPAGPERDAAIAARRDGGSGRAPGDGRSPRDARVLSSTSTRSPTSRCSRTRTCRTRAGFRSTLRARPRVDRARRAQPGFVAM